MLTASRPLPATTVVAVAAHPMPQAVTVRGDEARSHLPSEVEPSCRTPPVCCAGSTQKRCVPVTNHHVSLYVVNNLQLTIRDRTVRHSGHMTEWLDIDPGSLDWQPSGSAQRRPRRGLDVRDPRTATWSAPSRTARRPTSTRPCGVRRRPRRRRTGRSGSAAKRSTGPRRSPRERRDVFASLISREGCKPVRDADREVPASRRDGPPVGRAGPSPRGQDPPLRRHPARRGPARLVHPGAGRRRSARSRPSTTRSTW